MRAAQLLLIVMLVVSSLAAGQDWQAYKPEGDYSFNQVKDAVRRVTGTGTYTGWDDKAFSRYGDLVAVAILETLEDSEMASPEGAKSVLIILYGAFGCPQRCVRVVDERRPRVTLLLLEHLRAITGGKLLREIEDAKKHILEQARNAP